MHSIYFWTVFSQLPLSTLFNEFCLSLGILPPIQFCSNKSLIVKTGQIVIRSSQAVFRQFTGSFQAVLSNEPGLHQPVSLVFRHLICSHQQYQFFGSYQTTIACSWDNQNVNNCYLKKGFQILLSLLHIHIHCITQYYAYQGIFWKPEKTSKFQPIHSTM